jgi:hypothetical protein
MTDLEVVLLLAFLFMLWLHFRQRHDIRMLRHIVIDVGLKEARIEVDEKSNVVRVIRN